jgi:hypothetical protein
MQYLSKCGRKWKRIRVSLIVKVFNANAVFSDVVHKEHGDGWRDVVEWHAPSSKISGYRHSVQHGRILGSMELSCRQSHESYWQVRSLVIQFIVLQSVINCEPRKIFNVRIFLEFHHPQFHIHLFIQHALPHNNEYVLNMRYVKKIHKILNNCLIYSAHFCVTINLK